MHQLHLQQYCQEELKLWGQRQIEAPKYLASAEAQPLVWDLYLLYQVHPQWLHSAGTETGLLYGCEQQQSKPKAISILSFEKNKWWYYTQKKIGIACYGNRTDILLIPNGAYMHALWFPYTEDKLFSIQILK